MKMITPTFTKIPRTVGGIFIAAIAFIGTATQAQVPVFTNVWNVPALTFTDMPTNGNNIRGIGISPITTNVVYASTAGAANQGANLTQNHASVLDFATGTTQLAQLKTTPGGAQVNLTTVRVADDGRIYAVNVTTAPTGINQYFKIFQWASESDTTSEPLYVFDSTNYFNPISSGVTNSFAWRVGDYMDLRGSGTNTEIVVMGNSATTTNILIFRPTDDAVTNFNFIQIPLPVAGISFGGAGVAFEGTNNALWMRQGGGSANTRRIAYNPNTLTSAFTATNNVDQTACQGLKYISANGVNMLATVQGATGGGALQRARVFTIPTSPTALAISVLNFPMTNIAAAASVNANSLGNVDSRNGYIAFGAPGHGIALFRVDYITNSPPGATLSSANPTVVEGYTNTFTAIATGSAPLSYLWYFGSGGTTNQIPGATTNTYTVGPAQLTNAGGYFVIVTNPYGSATSAVSTFTVLPGKFTSYATNLWSLAPGSRPYLTTTDTQRGLSYDPVLNRLILISRSPTNAVHILDASTGADQGELDMALLLSPNPAPPGGAFVFNVGGVADDGVVYVGNLITTATPSADQSYTIYRWDSATNAVTIGQAFSPANPGIARLGDTMAVRGAGPDTQILASFRTGTNLALFLPNDGLGFTYGINIITVTNLPADAVANGFAGLGLVFGPGNTFWAKSAGFTLRLVAYDTNDFNAHVVATYTNLPSSDGPIGADNVNGYIASLGITQTPQNLSLWDVARGAPDAFQLDRELFPSNNPNLNGTGAIAFDTVNRRIFALDSNNGLIALAYSLYYVNIGPAPSGGIVTWPGTGNLQSSTNVLTGYTDILGATSPYTNTAPGQVFFRVRR